MDRTARLGNRIRQERLARGLSQEDLADMAGVSRRTIVRIEGGKYTTNRSTLRGIADALGITIWQLILEDDETE